jgi:hypothetical protein
MIIRLSLLLLIVAAVDYAVHAAVMVALQVVPPFSWRQGQ